MKTVVRDAGSGKWRLFERATENVVAKTVDDVLRALATVEEACVRHRRFAAGLPTSGASATSKVHDVERGIS